MLSDPFKEANHTLDHRAFPESSATMTRYLLPRVVKIEASSSVDQVALAENPIELSFGGKIVLSGVRLLTSHLAPASLSI